MTCALKQESLSGCPILRRCARSRWANLSHLDKALVTQIFQDVLHMRRSDIGVDIHSKEYESGQADIFRLIVPEAEFIIIKYADGNVAVVDFCAKISGGFAEMPSLNELPI